MNLSESSSILVGDSVNSGYVLPSVADQKFANFPFRCGTNMIVPDILTWIYLILLLEVHELCKGVCLFQHFCVLGIQMFMKQRTLRNFDQNL